MPLSKLTKRKDNFHNLIFGIDKMVTSGTVNSTIPIRPSLSKGRWWMEKDL